MDLKKFYQNLDIIFQTKDIKAAENYIIENMDYAKKEKNVPAIIALSNELGGIYRVTSRFEEAKKIYLVAIEAIKLLHLENTEQHGTTLLNLASVYSEFKSYDKALALYKQVAEIFANSGLDKDYRMAALYNNISHVYEELHQEDQALESAEQSMKIIRQLPGYEVELATTHTTLAQKYITKKKYTEAEANLKQAENIFSALPGKPNVHYAATLNTLGELCYLQNNLDGASSYFQRAMDIIKINYGENTSYYEVEKNLAKVKAMICQGHPTIRNDHAAKSKQIFQNQRKSGLEIAEDFFVAYGKKMIRDNFSEYEQYMAVGLVGEGSECLGFDDKISEDHDFAPRFSIWLPDDLFKKVGLQMQFAYDQLPKPVNAHASIKSAEGTGRSGVSSTEEFYKKYIGCSGIPKSNVEWLFASETGLSTVTNGKVFQDNLGDFTKTRNGLLAFYPKDVLLKKVVARMAQMSQSGQYNYERCMKRDDYAGAYMSCSEFIKATVSMVYLLNRRYMPFYKWMFKGMDNLENLTKIKGMLAYLITIPDTNENVYTKTGVMEGICIEINKELNKQKIISGSDPFLANHCQQVMNSISDPQIKNLPFLFDGSPL